MGFVTNFTSSLRIYYEFAQKITNWGVKITNFTKKLRIGIADTFVKKKYLLLIISFIEKVATNSLLCFILLITFE